jgi:hypothetical protein
MYLSIHLPFSSLVINLYIKEIVRILSEMLGIRGSLFGICRRVYLSILPPIASISPPTNILSSRSSHALREPTNASALESHDDEFPLANVTKIPSHIVKPPRVAESPVQFECKVHSILRIAGNSLVGHSDIVIGRVVGIHIRGEFITDEGVSDFVLCLFKVLKKWKEEGRGKGKRQDISDSRGDGKVINES